MDILTKSVLAHKKAEISDFKTELKTFAQKSENISMSTQVKHPKKQGQILVLMAMFSTTLIILFGMVVSIGHLVEAKMNLQNAVDLAAMAGASQQARFLDQLSLVNYRMRQNYKWLLYDLYVTESRFSLTYKNQIALATPGKLDRVAKGDNIFGICQQVRGFCGGRLPAPFQDTPGCVSATTDLCQNAGTAANKIPGITPSPIISTNPVLLAINASILNLQQQEIQLCDASRDQNKQYVGYVMTNFDKRQRFQMDQMAKIVQQFENVFSSGTEMASGFAGDEVISKTFNDNLISANQGSNPRLEWINHQKSRRPPPNTVPQGGAILQKQAPGGNFSEYFERQRVSFSIPYVDFISDSGGGCSVAWNRFDFDGSNGAGSFIGLSRARVNPGEVSSPVKITFNVALRAEVTPHLLFWPQSFTPTLVAVGAAKPFGSKIGPSALQTVIETTGQTQPDTRGLANMSFYPGDDGVNGDTTTIHGVGHKYILNKLVGKLSNKDSGVNNLRPRTVDSDSCKGPNPDFICYALAPTLYEGFFWNAYPYAGGGDVKGAFTSANTFGNLGDVVFQGFPQDIQSTNADYEMKDRNAPAQGLWHETTYMGNDNIFRLGKGSFYADTASALSSWSPAFDPSDPNAEIAKYGRIGYQIKLVSIGQICNEIDQGGMSELKSDALNHYCRDDVGVYH